MVTLEQVEKLCERANISYDEARRILERTDGDLLEAVVLLEKEGRIEAPKGNGYYNSKEASSAGNGSGAGTTMNTGNVAGVGTGKERGDSYSANGSAPVHTQSQGGTKEEATFGDSLNSFFRWVGRLLHIGNTNSFEVRKNERKVMVFPVTVFVLLLLFAFWITIPLMIVGLFFGLRYVFSGPEVKATGVNKAMKTAAEAAEDFKSRIKYENDEK